MVDPARLHPWTRDSYSSDFTLRRRGAPSGAEYQLWRDVLDVALALDDLAADLDGAPLLLRQLDAAAQGLLGRLPTSSRGPRPVLFVLLDSTLGAPEGAPDENARAALADALAQAAGTLAALAGAPVARDAHALRREAADVLTGIAPLLASWAQRAPHIELLAALPPPEPEPEPDDRY